MPTLRVTPPPITTPKDLDRSLLDSSPPEGTELREATSLVNSIVRSSTLETPVKRYIERSGSALERTTSENTLLRRENAEFRELLRYVRNVRRGSASRLKVNSSLIRRKSSNSSSKRKRRRRRESRRRDERRGLRLPKSRTRKRKVSRRVYTRARVIVLS